MNHSDETEILVDEEISIEKPSLKNRIVKDRFARLRRKETKHIVDVHSYKEEKDAQERLSAKKRLEKQKKRKKQNTV